ncbi:MAG: GSCFA domain-containing protein [Bermanella sp.]
MLQQKEPFWDTLIPDSYKNMEQEFDEGYKYRLLHEISIKQSALPDNKCQQMGGGKHRAYFQSLDENDVSDTFNLLASNSKLEFNSDVLGLFSKVITPEIEEELNAYFNSNFAIMFYSSRNITLDSRETNPSIKWHCDGAPTKSAMLMCYLNGEEDHESSTLFLDEEPTRKLKEVGYIYSLVVDRHEEIDDLLDYYEIDNDIHRHAFKAGESILFGASQVAHRAEVPKIEGARTTLDFCFIPSPVPWREAIAKGYVPANQCVHYKGQVQRLLAAVNIRENPNNTDLESAQTEVIQIPAGGRICSEESLKLHISAMFSDKKYGENLFAQVTKNKINYATLTVNELLMLLKKSFHNGLDWSGAFNQQDLTNLKDLIEFEQKYSNSVNRFSVTNKPNPDGVMWPIPNHPKHPKSKFDMLPYAVEHKIMDKSTPIGSAGSCFAMEIAKVLQTEEFNYVVTELGDNPEQEAYIDGYKVGSGDALYSANFGILFNTPSLRQLAEKAFGEREFTKYLVQAEQGLYMDPYRENVYFKSKENFLRDYPKHIEAIRQTLLQSEVFIFTAGLNECWELFDGSVISRNPRDSFFHLMQHKVLTVQENIDNIMSFFNLVKRHNPKFKLILTLSPVPLLATGRGDTHHIIEANTHSKAVLRVALEEVVKQHEDIYYLPSFELVTECMPNAWKEDHRHVTKETVSKVISMFKNMFVR